MNVFQNTTGHFTERLCFCRNLFGPLPRDFSRKHSAPAPCSPDIACLSRESGHPGNMDQVLLTQLPPDQSGPREPKKWAGNGKPLGGVNPKAWVIPLQKKVKERG